MPEKDDLMKQAEQNGIILSYGNDEPDLPKRTQETTANQEPKIKSDSNNNTSPLNPSDIISATIKVIDDTTKTTRIKMISGIKGTPILDNLKTVVSAWLLNNYELVNKYPTEINDNDTIEIHIKHQVKQISRTKKIKRTIEYSANDDTAVPDTVINTLTFTQSGTQDLVTNEPSWDLTPITKEFPEVKTPQIKGYTPDIDTIPAEKITIDNDKFNMSFDRTHVVNYLVNKQIITIDIFDQTTDKIIKTITLTGFTKHIANFNLNNLLNELDKNHYEIVDNKLPNPLVFQADKNLNQFKISVKHKEQIVTIDNIQQFSNLSNLTLTKTIHRTINLKAPNRKFEPIIQTVTFKRSAKIDLVTSKVTYSNYESELTFPKIALDKIDGYELSQNEISEQTITAENTDINHTVNLKPNTQIVKIVFEDMDDNKVINTLQIKGVTDETRQINITDEISDILNENYLLEHNPLQEIFKFTPAIKTVTVTFSHRRQTLTLDNPINAQTGENISSNLRKTITRTIKFITPDTIETPKDIIQTVHFNRTGLLDLVSKQITYSTWSKDQTFPNVEVPKLVGYTPNKNSIPELSVSGSNDNILETVTYDANNQTIIVEFYDKDSKTLLGKEAFNGRTNEPLDFNLQELIDVIQSQGYVVEPYDFALKMYPTTSKTIEIDFKHKVLHLSTNDQNVPENINLKKEYTFTLSFVDKNNNDLKKPMVIKQIMTRTATVDLVTKDITYSEFEPANKIPRLIELTPINSLIPIHRKIEVPDLKTIKDDSYGAAIYVANSQEVKLDFITDNDEKIKSYDLIFKLREPKKLHTKILIEKIKEKGYELAANSYVPKILQYDKSLPDIRTYTIKLKEIFDQTIETRKITRTISIVNPDKSRRIIQQVAILTRVVEVGKASKRKIDHEWSTNLWDAYIPANITGYSPNVKAANESLVTEDTKDQVININYVELPQKSVEPKSNLDIEPPKENEFVKFLKKLFGITSDDESNSDNLKLDAPKDKK